MTVSTSVIVEVGIGGRALLRTADTIARQRRPAEGVVLVKSSAFASTPLVESVVSRLGALVVEPGSHPGVAWNAAVRRTAAPYLVVLPAGLALHDSFIEQCESMFRGDALLAAVVPAIALRTADGSGELHWIPEGLSATAVLSDTRSVPFSMASLKRRCFNQHLLDRILAQLATEGSVEKSSPVYEELCNYGTIHDMAA